MTLDSIEIFDHAHTVLSYVSLIQIDQRDAREVATFNTVPYTATRKSLADLDYDTLRRMLILSFLLLCNRDMLSCPSYMRDKECSSFHMGQLALLEWDLFSFGLF